MNARWPEVVHDQDNGVYSIYVRNKLTISGQMWAILYSCIRINCLCMVLIGLRSPRYMDQNLGPFG
jgi:hypothetical protein